MRLDEKKAEFLKKAVKSRIQTASVFLFGSRADDDKKGGDIDILVLDENEKINLNDKIKIGAEFDRAFGLQKLDIVSFLNSEKSNFKDMILDKVVKL